MKPLFYCIDIKCLFLKYAYSRHMFIYSYSPVSLVSINFWIRTHLPLNTLISSTELAKWNLQGQKLKARPYLAYKVPFQVKNWRNFFHKSTTIYAYKIDVKMQWIIFDLQVHTYALEWFHPKGHGVWSDSGIEKKFAHICIENEHGLYIFAWKFAWFVRKGFL